MPIELKLLLWATALALAQSVIAVIGALSQVGLKAFVGNRDPFPSLEGWAGRAQRAHRNLLESLVLFAILVLVAHVTGRVDSVTLLGAQLFFWARVAYVPIYLAGIPWLRTGVWGISIFGLILMLAQII